MLPLLVSLAAAASLCKAIVSRLNGIINMFFLHQKIKILMNKLSRSRWLGLALTAAGLIVVALVIVRATGLLSRTPICYSRSGLPTGGAWTVGAAAPRILSETAAAAIGTRVYIAGGMDADWNALNQLSIFDTASASWHTGAPLPLAVNHVNAAAVNEGLYLIGGYDNISKMVNATPDIAAGWRYDPQADTWTPIADMPAPRAASAMVALDGKLFVVGGTGAGARAVWVYDPETNSWDTSRRGLMPTPREHTAAVALDGKIYVVGGRWNNVPTAAVEVYDPAADRWTELADMPTPRSSLALAALNDRIYAAGGEDLNSTCTYAAHEVYDPETNLWEELAGMPTPRHSTESAVIGNRWYIIGGATQAARRTNKGLTGIVEIFTVED